MQKFEVKVMKKLFGNNITPSCKYCDLSRFEDNVFYCAKNRKNIDHKCKKFQYNPLKRVPKSTPALQQFSSDDFSLVVFNEKHSNYMKIE